jgi:hypothetical protein
MLILIDWAWRNVFVIAQSVGRKEYDSRQVSLYMKKPLRCWPTQG